MAKTPQDIRELLGLGYTPSEDQSKIIQHGISEPLLVIAGAGSGKTETMANLIFNIILEHSSDISPNQILGMTFTNKAVSELSLRIRRGVDRLSRTSERNVSRNVLPKICTYNSFAGQICSEYGIHAGINASANLITQTDRVLIAREAAANIVTQDLLVSDIIISEWLKNSDDSIESIKLNSLANDALTLAGEISNNLQDVDEISQYLQFEFANFDPLKTGPRRRDKEYRQEIAELVGEPINYDCGIKAPVVKASLAKKYLILKIVKEFARLKEDRNVLDFGDQTWLAYKIAQETQEVREQYAGQYKVVILDEYQDTSVSQVNLLKSVFGENHTLIAVGDPNQAIYEWRGASSAGINNFVKVFKAKGQDYAKKQTLPTSYRNDDQILAVANNVSSKIRTSDSLQAVPPLTPRPGSGEGYVEVALCAFEDRIDSELSFGEETDAALQDKQIKYLESDEPSEIETVTAFLAEHFLKYNTEVDANVKEHREIVKGGDKKTYADAKGVPLKPRTAAILARARTEFNRYRNALESKGIPVQIVGLSGLLELPEIKDLLALIHVVNDDAASDQMLRLLTCPRINIDAKMLQTLKNAGPRFKKPNGGTDHDKAWTLVHKVRLLGTNYASELEDSELTDTIDLEVVTGPRFAKAQVDEFREKVKSKMLGEGYAKQYNAIVCLADTINELFKNIQTYDTNSLIRRIVELSGIEEELRVIGAANKIPDHLSALSVRSFLEATNTYFSTHNRASISDFLAYLKIALAEEQGLDQELGYINPEAVQISTIHSAKGLEWDIVCCVANTVKQYFKDQKALRASGGGLLDEFPDFTPSPGEMWFKHSEILPDKFRLDAESGKSLPTLSDIDSLAKYDYTLKTYSSSRAQAQLDSARRLAYVAFTRAKSHLLITASLYARDNEAPTTPTPFFLDALECANKHNLHTFIGHGESEKYTGAMRTTLLAAQLNELFPALGMVPSRKRKLQDSLWPNYDQRFKNNKYWQACSSLMQKIDNATKIDISDIKKQDPDLALLLEECDGLPKTLGELVNKHPLPEHLTTSDLVRLAEDEFAFRRSLLRPMPKKPTFVDDIGTRFHNWVQWFYDSGKVHEHINGKFKYISDSLNSLLTIDTLAKGFLLSIWSKLEPIGVELELPVIAQAAKGKHEVISKIDAVFKIDGKVLIVDWKTGAKPSGIQKEHKTIQLAQYRDAYLQYNTNIKSSDVDAAFVYVKQDYTDDNNVLRFNAKELDKISANIKPKL